jgi:hypothetical protein
LHIDHEIVEYVAAEEPEYEEIVEVYEEEVSVQGALEPSTTNFAAYLCYMCIYVSGVLLKPTCINITTQESY